MKNAGKVFAARLRAMAEQLERHPPQSAHGGEIARRIEELESLLFPEESGREKEGEKDSGGDIALSTDEEIRIWCDGSCSPNPGPGGWGALIVQNGERRELSGASPRTTNNIMEMSAAIEALKQTPEGAVIQLTTDSRYLMDGITRWIEGWKRKGWRKSDGNPVLNQEYWRKLDALLRQRTVSWSWVRGHSGNPENERCDELANHARLGLTSR